jgi:hypothetical protein
LSKVVRGRTAAGGSLQVWQQHVLPLRPPRGKCKCHEIGCMSPEVALDGYSGALNRYPLSGVTRTSRLNDVMTRATRRRSRPSDFLRFYGTAGPRRLSVTLLIRADELRTECPVSRAALRVSKPIPLLAPMIRTVATPVNALIGLATHRHVRSRQPHRKMDTLNHARRLTDFASVIRR